MRSLEFQPGDQTPPAGAIVAISFLARFPIQRSLCTNRPLMVLISAFSRAAMIFLKPQRRCDIVAHSALRFCIRAAILTFIALTLSVRTPTQTVPEKWSPVGESYGHSPRCKWRRHSRCDGCSRRPRLDRSPHRRNGRETDFSSSMTSTRECKSAGDQCHRLRELDRLRSSLTSGEFKSLGGIELAIAKQETTVLVTSNPVEAVDRSRSGRQEKQRVLASFPISTYRMIRMQWLSRPS